VSINASAARRVLGDGGQRRARQACRGDVVEADHGDFGDRSADVLQRMHRTDRRDVMAAKIASNSAPRSSRRSRAARPPPRSGRRRRELVVGLDPRCAQRRQYRAIAPGIRMARLGGTDKRDLRRRA
jgi:hypothetical protein